MKKVSTVAAKQSRNFSQQKLTIGLDLGDRSSWYCVLDERGEVLLEQRLSTTPKAIREVFGGMPRSRIALETGMHSPWVSRLLSELGHEVIVAHARSVRLIGESRKKDDRLDAQTLARLARIDPQLLCPVKHRSARAQADLTVIRARAGLVRARTALVNTARGLAKSYGERLRGCNVRNMSAADAIAMLSKIDVVVILSDVNMPEIDGVDLALKARRMCPRTRVLLMSGNETSETIGRRPECEGCVFELMAKPFGARELTEKIKAAIGDMEERRPDSGTGAD